MRNLIQESTVLFVLLLTASTVYGDKECVLRPALSKVQPSGFIANRGQWDDQAKYKASIPGGAVWLTEDGITCQISTAEPSSSGLEPPIGPPNGTAEHEVFRIAFKFENGSVIVPAELMTGRCNYIIGNDPGGWYTDIPCYRTVSYEDVSGDYRIELLQLMRRLRIKVIFDANSTASKFAFRLEDVDWSMNTERSLNINTDAGTRLALPIL